MRIGRGCGQPARAKVATPSRFWCTVALVGIRGFSLRTSVAAVTIAAAAVGCSLDTEPARMCGSLELGASSARSLEGDTPAVVALSDGAGGVTIVRACDGFGCEAELLSETRYLNANPDQLLLTASGRWLTYRVGPDLFRVDLDDPTASAEGGPGGVHEIVGSLLGGDWLVYRTWGEGPAPEGAVPVNESELWAYYAGDVDELPLDEFGEPTTRPHFRLGEASQLDLRVAAMGHRHVVARRILGNGEEELYLIRIAPARRHDELGSSSRGKPILLARGSRFTRVLITSGPSPAEHGDPWEFQHEVPTDVRVIATSGSGERARTLVYAVSDASPIANFEGSVVSSPVALEDIAGLSAVSPSGSHLAYLTPRGSLALRDLENHDACMIRPANAARHTVAGFAADGTLYFESVERGRSEVGGAAGPDASIVYAYDPAREEFTALTDDRHIWRLYAVPPQRYHDEGGARLPWAVVALDGFYAAGGGDRPQPLHYDDVSFLPRGDDSLWLLEGEESDTFNEPNRLTVRRVMPSSGAEDTVDFDHDDADPTVLEGDELHDRFTRSYSNKASICVSTSQSASRTTPWATTCSTPDKPTSYLDSGLPNAETP